MPVDSDGLATKYRAATLNSQCGSVLVSRIAGSEQERDLTSNPTFSGFGRIRHFHRRQSKGWPDNPLPIDPAAKALGFGFGLPNIEALVFQNAACNWRCWYCYVPFSLLKADPGRSAWISAKQVVDALLELEGSVSVLDLSGGQPELTPEWVLQVLDECSARQLKSVYVWSDDNLSTDYLWRYLSTAERRRIAEFRNYGRVGCFKGFDEDSFAFNTATTPDLFVRQFELMKRYLGSGIDVYSYVTFTSHIGSDLRHKIERFVDRLQLVHSNLPLRTIPLEVEVYTPVKARLNRARQTALAIQHEAVEIWKEELSRRYPSELLALPITEVALS